MDFSIQKSNVRIKITRHSVHLKSTLQDICTKFLIHHQLQLHHNLKMKQSGEFLYENSVWTHLRVHLLEYVLPLDYQSCWVHFYYPFLYFPFWLILSRVTQICHLSWWALPKTPSKSNRLINLIRTNHAIFKLAFT